MKHVILTSILGSTLLLSPHAFAQSSSERAELLRQKWTALQRDRDASAQMLSRLLYTDVTIEFDETPLRDAVDSIERVTGVTLVGRYQDDRVGHGLDPDAPIILEVEEAPALTVLEMILAQNTDPSGEATWQVRNGFIELGTRERLAAPAAQEIRYYPVRDLMMEVPRFTNAPRLDLDTALSQGGGGGFGGGGFSGGGVGGGGGGYSGSIIGQRDDDGPRPSEHELSQDLIDLITKVVEPDAWDVNGGEWATIRYYQGTLIVRAPDFIHRQIAGYPFPLTRPARQGDASARSVTFTEAYSQLQREQTNTGAEDSPRKGESDQHEQQDAASSDDGDIPEGH